MTSNRLIVEIKKVGLMKFKSIMCSGCKKLVAEEGFQFHADGKCEAKPVENI